MAVSRHDDVVGTGLVALDRIHVETPQPLFEELGGSCGNVLISLAMLGHSVTPLLRLGADETGARLELDLRLAGADTRLVRRHNELRSPIIVELLDPVSNEHRFSSTCPESLEVLGAYQSITRFELEPARPAIAACRIFYADRVSETICEAMEEAAAGGAIVHFEPSSVPDSAMFERALAVSDIFKFSVDRLPADFAMRMRADAFAVVTAGKQGLEVHHSGAVHHSEAWSAPKDRDTCGSGDMVTIGLLDAILQTHARSSRKPNVETIMSGVRAGQRLAAANCAFVGARGLFRERGTNHARSILAKSSPPVRLHA